MSAISLWLRTARATAATLAVVTVAGCGGAAGPKGTSSPGGAGGLQGLVLTPARPAPALALRDYRGRRVELAALRGRPVFVTFLYTRCPDVCPLIVSNLANAQRRLGRAAASARFLAVTVDPRRDTPRAVAAFLSSHAASGRVDYLLGSTRDLRRVWRAWDVAVQSAGVDRVGHSAVVYGIGASGREEVVLPSDFSPAQVVHDVALLASS